MTPRKDKDVTFEVKEDVRAKDTGNIVIEFESWGKPSGIQKSIADFWIFRLYKDDIMFNHILPIETVKQLIEEQKYFKIEQMKHTDSKNKLYFFKEGIITKEAILKRRDVEEVFGGNLNHLKESI